MAQRISPTFSERQQKIITAMAFKEGVEKAKIVKDGVNEKIEKLSEKEVNSLLALYDRMTPGQRKNPEQ